MFPLNPLGAAESLPYAQQSVYRETFLGKPSAYENPRHQHLRTSIRTNCNPLMPFLMTKFRPGYDYSLDHVEIVKQLREIYEKMSSDYMYSTYSIDYAGKPSGIKYPAEANPVVTGREIYNPPRKPESVAEKSYQAVRVPKELQVHKIDRDVVARRGMMPMMYPHGNTNMETLTETEDQFQVSKDMIGKDIGKKEKIFKTKAPPAKAPPMTSDYIPVHMQPIT